MWVWGQHRLDEGGRPPHDTARRGVPCRVQTELLLKQEVVWSDRDRVCQYNIQLTWSGVQQSVWEGHRISVRKHRCILVIP